MAAAEARAVWQRTVNRCFVQEDAKRAPKLACCQSSSSASTKHIDTGSSGAVDLQDQSSAAFMPLNRNPRFPELSPDTRWWIHMQTGYANQKELMAEQTKLLETELDAAREGSVESAVKDSKKFHTKREQGSNNFEKADIGVGEKEARAFKCENMQEYVELTETKGSYGFVGLDDHVGYGFSKTLNEVSFDPGSPWNLSNEKAGPWWRTTDKDELATFVAQKSLDYIENCDLPTPQKMHTSKHSYGSPRSFDSDRLSPLDPRSPAGCVSNRPRDGHGQYGCERSFSCSTGVKDIAETQSYISSESGLSKAELLEALRHSQTRAREAEKAAKEAYAEKEHHIKLLFKQASQLFAYKQWFQLLQLEALYLQIKKKHSNSDHCNPPIPGLPWMSWEAGKPRKRWQKGKRIKRAKANADITKYAVAFAVGLSLVGAGLLLGWTVGWMLPF